MLNDGRFLWSRNARSALDAVYAHMEAKEETEEADDLDAEDLAVQLILLERED